MIPSVALSPLVLFKKKEKGKKAQEQQLQKGLCGSGYSRSAVHIHTASDVLGEGGSAGFTLEPWVRVQLLVKPQCFFNFGNFAYFFLVYVNIHAHACKP